MRHIGYWVLARLIRCEAGQARSCLHSVAAAAHADGVVQYLEIVKYSAPVFVYRKKKRSYDSCAVAEFRIVRLCVEVSTPLIEMYE